MKQQNAILELLNTITKALEEMDMREAFSPELLSLLEQLAKYLNSTTNEAFLIAALFATGFRYHNPDLRDVASFLNCRIEDLLPYYIELEELQKRRLISNKALHNYNRRRNTSVDSLTLNPQLIRAIFTNKPMPNLSPAPIEDPLAFLEYFYETVAAMADNEDISRLTTEDVDALFAEYDGLSFVRALRSLPLNNIEKAAFCIVVWKKITSSSSFDVDDLSGFFFRSIHQRHRYMSEIVDESHPFVKHRLFTYRTSRFANHSEIELDEVAVDFLEKNGLKMLQKMAEKKGVQSDEIPEKTLYYGKEKDQIDMLSSMLAQDNFQQMQQRLREKALPVGITVLLHGHPGTGKTETAKQLARKTNRAIIQVDMSSTKSMWLGGSEKQVQKIFTDYQNVAKNAEYTPILLLNEADALLNKRLNVEHGVDQTLNAIQNILLEALEKFEGILIATTNRPQSMDDAFERRFLFKVKFDAPTTEAKVAIWADKLPDLSPEEQHTLAATFPLSGGQIDNVVRKREMHHIIYGNIPGFEKMLKFCEDEIQVQQKSTIGFKTILIE